MPLLFHLHSNREVILQRIQNLIEGGARLGGPKGEGGEDVREVLYTSLTIFLHALMDYTKRLYPDFNSGELAMLVEAVMWFIKGVRLWFAT